MGVIFLIKTAWFTVPTITIFAIGAIYEHINNL